MASYLSPAGKAAMLNSLGAAYASLHSADPVDGETAELSGSGYERQPITWTPATDADLVMAATFAVFDVPASTVAFIGLWTALDGDFLGCIDVVNEIYAEPGTYTLTDANTVSLS